MNLPWPSIPLGKVAKVVGGYAFKSADFVSSGIPVIKIKNIEDKNVSLSNLEFLNNSFDSMAEKYKVRFGDILISLTGSHITMPSSAVGRVARSRHQFTFLLNQRVGKIQVNDKLADESFVYYSMIDSRFREQIGLLSRGAANQANISGGDVESVEINCPPLPTQKKIAGVLSAYDDLIEANLNRIKLLEEIAQITYEEWFVRLRFPGHETTPTNPENGLPEGWTPKVLKEFFPIKTGKKDANIQTADGMYPFFTCSQGIYRCDVYSFDAEAIILSGNGEFNVKYYRGKFEAYQRNYVLIPNNREFLFLLFLFIRHFLGRITAGSKGSVIKYLTKDLIADTKFIEPSRIILDEFNKLAFPVFYQIENLEKQNALLKEARDLLLPRLMTGLIDIDDYLARNASAMVAA